MYPISEDSFLDMGEFEEMRRMEKKLNLKSEYVQRGILITGCPFKGQSLAADC